MGPSKSIELNKCTWFHDRVKELNYEGEFTGCIPPPRVTMTFDLKISSGSAFTLIRFIDAFLSDLAFQARTTLLGRSNLDCVSTVHLRTRSCTFLAFVEKSAHSYVRSAQKYHFGNNKLQKTGAPIFG